MPAGHQVPPHQRQRPALVRERPHHRRRQVERRGLVRRVVALASRDAPVQVPRPFPVCVRERVVGRHGGHGQHQRAQQRVRLVGLRRHERGRPGQLAVELGQRDLPRPRTAEGAPDPSARAGRQRVDGPAGQVRRRGPEDRSRRRALRMRPGQNDGVAIGVASNVLAVAPVIRDRLRSPNAASCGWARWASRRSWDSQHLEEAEGVGRLEVLGPEVLHAAGVARGWPRSPRPGWRARPRGRRGRSSASRR